MIKTEKFTPDNYDAFISYRHDTGFYMAQVIYDKLVQNGYSVFMDKRLKRGEFEPQIKTAVEKSRNFILVLFPGDLNNTNKENDWIRKDPSYGKIVCRCEQVSEGEIVDCIRRKCGARSVVAVKKRVRPGMGKCQGGFCEPLILEILSRELNKDPMEIRYDSNEAYILNSETKGGSK